MAIRTFIDYYGDYKDQGELKTIQAAMAGLRVVVLVQELKLVKAVLVACTLFISPLITC